jgi:hypothetical protein
MTSESSGEVTLQVYNARPEFVDGRKPTSQQLYIADERRARRHNTAVDCGLDRLLQVHEESLTLARPEKSGKIGNNALRIELIHQRWTDRSNSSSLSKEPTRRIHIADVRQTNHF